MPVSIPLSQGKSALVDDEDADLASFKWCAKRDKKTFYAKRHVRKDNGKMTTRTLHKDVAVRMGIEGEVDHKDHNGLNCTRKNLRAATGSQNMANQGLRVTSTSGVKGVSWYEPSQSWRAYITVNYKRQHLGYYKNKDLAEAAVVAARERLHGSFACHA